MNISKELLSEVLLETLKRHDTSFKSVTESVIDKELVHINYRRTDGIITGYFINIYELAHKCKEWAYKHKYDLLSAFYQDCSVIDLRTHNEVYLTTTMPETEFKEYVDIFKACQWILDNKE